MARKSDAAPAPATPPTDAPGHRYEPLDPAMDPEAARPASSAGFIQRNRHMIGIFGAIVVAAVVIAMMVKGHWGPAPSATTTAAPQGGARQEVAEVRTIKCPQASSQEAQKCLVRTPGSDWFGPGEGTQVNGMNLCYSPENRVSVEYRLTHGLSQWRFVTESGTVEVEYRLRRLAPGEVCTQI